MPKRIIVFILPFLKLFKRPRSLKVKFRISITIFFSMPSYYEKYF